MKFTVKILNKVARDKLLFKSHKKHFHFSSAIDNMTKKIYHIYQSKMSAKKK